MQAPLPLEHLPAGTELFGYRIEQILGKGSMGTVYRATQLSLQRPVALKVLSEKSLRNPAVAEDFLREARSTAKLAHQNLVMIHDVHADLERHIYAYSMEYVPGITLTKLVTDSGPLKRQQALHILYQIAQALAAAHRADLIHRDVKPDNILVAPNGLAKLLDLGLVRDRLGDHQVRAPGRRILSIVGTPDWSSPEQSRNPDQASTASDVFSLGATFYYMLTGSQPFNGDTVIDLIVRVCTEAVTYPPTVPRDCQHLLNLMLAKDTDARLPDGDAVVKALDTVARGKTPTLPNDEGTGRVTKPGLSKAVANRRRVLRRYRYGR
ncbi:MAG: serine/threonine-protein kinase [Planctomycetota bacterium]